MVQQPNKEKFLSDLFNAADIFADDANKYNKIVSISHNDADGISSLYIVQNLLHKMNINCEYDYFIYNRSVSWANYLRGIISKRQSERTAFIFTDVGSNLDELVPIIKNRKEIFVILDHHEVDNDLELLTFPENLYFVNPTIYGFDGLDHIAGASLAYLFAKRIRPNVINQGWLTIIGIAGDSLKSMDKLTSFNKEIYEELLDEEIFLDKKGLILFGSMHDTVKNSLKYSILPFIPSFGGDEKKIKSFLSNIQIDPNKKLADLNEEETEKILSNMENPNVEVGHYAILPQKQELLQFAFEHALLLNVLCFKNISAALSIIKLQKPTRYAKNIYIEYVENLVRNLKILSDELSTLETNNAIFIEVKGRIPPSNWSDTASFSAVNEIFDPNKLLLLGGVEKKSNTIKLSIRCTRKFLEQHNGYGVNKIISNIKERLGGQGGGHKLAGGIRLSKASYKFLKEKADEFIL